MCRASFRGLRWGPHYFSRLTMMMALDKFFYLTFLLLALVCSIHSAESLSFSFPYTGFQILIDLSSSASVEQDAITSFLADAWIANDTQMNAMKKNFFLRLKNKNELKSIMTSLSQFHGVIAPIEARSELISSISKDEDRTLIWDVSRDSNLKNSGQKYNVNETFCLCGDLSFAYHMMNKNLPSGSRVLWRPSPIDGLDDLAIDVWKVRSTGCLGMVLPYKTIAQAEKEEVNTIFRKLKRPCSAMDYPPTIYMIGEDEIS